MVDFCLVLFQLPAIPRAQSSVLHSMSQLFPKEAILLSTRQNFLLSKNDFYKHINTVQLSEDYLDPVSELIKSLAGTLNEARALIVEGHLVLEKVAGFPCDTPIFVRYCSEIANALVDARDVAGGLTEHLSSRKSQQWMDKIRKRRPDSRPSEEDHSRKKAKRIDKSVTNAGATQVSSPNGKSGREENSPKRGNK